MLMLMIVIVLDLKRIDHEHDWSRSMKKPEALSRLGFSKNFYPAGAV